MRLISLLSPVFFALYSILALYAHNIDELEVGQILPALKAVSIGALSCAGLIVLKTRDARKAGIIASLLVIMTLFYGLLFNTLSGALDNSVSHLVLFPLCIFFLILIAGSSVQTEERVRGANTLLMTISIALLAMTSLEIAYYQLFSQKARIVSRWDEDAAVDVLSMGDRDLPRRNIYYLIFDRYAANRTLKNEYDFDNKPFLDFLASKGFYVARNSFANYTKTAHSLASSLNMEYLDQLARKYADGVSDWKPVYRMIRDFKVWRLLKGFGYKYIHLGSWWDPTRTNPLADENYYVHTLAEFEYIFLRTTALSPFSNLIAAYDMQYQCERVVNKSEKLQELSQYDKPLFVFAHMLIPHPPYVFDGQGRCMSRDQIKSRGNRENYLGQIQYVNFRVEKLLETLLAEEPKPIIIIQSDEGPFPERYRDFLHTFNWRAATDRELQQKFRILNALYLPTVGREQMYPELSPVNTFRIIFSEYFGQEYELLPDRSYSFYDESHLYDFFEITDIVK